jgi:hypothetical protein
MVRKGVRRPTVFACVIVCLSGNIIVSIVRTYTLRLSRIRPATKSQSFLFGVQIFSRPSVAWGEGVLKNVLIGARTRLSGPVFDRFWWNFVRTVRNISA